MVKTYMEAFEEGDHEKILSCLTDDVIWEIPGHVYLQGKAQFDNEISPETADGPPDISITRLIGEEDIVVAEGAVTGKMKNGDMIDLLFCDVFHFSEGKISKLTSYLAPRKFNNQ